MKIDSGIDWSAKTSVDQNVPSSFDRGILDYGNCDKFTKDQDFPWIIMVSENKWTIDLTSNRLTFILIKVFYSFSEPLNNYWVWSLRARRTPLDWIYGNVTFFFMWTQQSIHPELHLHLQISNLAVAWPVFMGGQTWHAKIMVYFLKHLWLNKFETIRQ